MIRSMMLHDDILKLKDNHYEKASEKALGKGFRRNQVKYKINKLIFQVVLQIVSFCNLGNFFEV